MWPNLDWKKKSPALKKGKGRNLYWCHAQKHTHTPLIIYLLSKLRRGEATESKKHDANVWRPAAWTWKLATCTTYSSCSPPRGANKVKRSFTAVFSSTADPRDRRWNRSDVSAALLKGIWAAAVCKRGSGCFSCIQAHCLSGSLIFRGGGRKKMQVLLESKLNPVLKYNGGNSTKDQQYK